ncbi:right-handed parallel beta-helix repeat-containing protein [Olleya sp. HaHaR_3_96]|uniref:right-handed parallel beta-helix repeat-containing protein n=1 Tax=Olleya sp. HaHaR_3_96 TaxID=2745560 RepID=UPI001C4FB6BC|nr:right-handed parallel beta-helix repeat-containing protein [Olleya sp. HaHaR_3_96]QXP58750.1 right-handed parallel beta-helix repeat-containing protein [Olleya sp. HaHaR_3_96]
MTRFSYLIFTALLFINISCSKDDDTTNEPAAIVIEDCTFNLADFSSNTTIVIDCNLNLNGETVNLAENVILSFDGGSITNGTLTFNSGEIDGELLNSELNIEGEATLSSSEFTFLPENWDLLEGEITTEEAIENKDKLNNIIALVKSLEADTFSIGKFDAYFYGDIFSTAPADAYDNAIQIPSDFHFKMSDETVLRSQPTNHFASRIIGIYKGDNITVSGGTLIGDRYTHDYTPVRDLLDIDRSGHSYGTLLFIAGGDNVLIDNVTIKEGTGDAIGIGGSTIRNTDGSIRTGERIATDLTISNCDLSDCRRNIISVIDGNGVVIEGNTISKAGGERDGYPEAAGDAPQFGIDLEAYRERDDENNLLEYERVENVIIRDNIFTDNYAGDIVVYTANDVLIEYNEMDNFVGSYATFNCKITHNTLIARDDIITEIGIGLQEVIRNDEHLAYNNEISDNYVEGYDASIIVAGLNNIIKDNELKDFNVGISFKNLTNGTISNNTLTSERITSNGYFTYSGNAKNSFVTGDVVNVQHKTVLFYKFNKDITDGRLTFDDVTFNSVYPSSANRVINLDDSHNITFQNCVITEGIEDNGNSNGIESIDNTFIVF